MTLTSATQRGREQPADKNAIRPFHVSVPEAELTELRRRVAAARLPERETVADFSQGVPLATTQKLARYWATEYDWRKVEARLNAVPNFITEIDVLDIHFLHVRSKHEHALPVRIASAWIVLMKRLGYTSYVAQGGDWGAGVVALMGVQAPEELLAIHTNMPAVIPPAIDAAALAGAPVPAGLSADEKHAYEQLAGFYKNVYYAFFMGTRPQTLTALADSPVGLATFMIDHDARSLELISRAFVGVAEGLTRDDVLDT